jgi:DNA-binding NarL/FixJ family response regulator
MASMTSGVFVVDDDPVFRDLARRMLQNAGLTFLGEADTVSAAMAAVHDVEPSAVLVDVGLPDGDGVALAASLATLAWRPSVLLTSTDPDAVSPADVQRSGARGFLAKADLPNAPLDVLLAPP